LVAIAALPAGSLIAMDAPPVADPLPTVVPAFAGASTINGNSVATAAPINSRCVSFEIVERATDDVCKFMASPLLKPLRRS
jgi:hypothetical protein